MDFLSSGSEGNSQVQLSHENTEIGTVFMLLSGKLFSAEVYLLKCLMHTQL
jgi:hypothetical protein